MNNILLDRGLIEDDIVLSSLDHSIYDISSNTKVIINLDNSNHKKCEFNLGENSYLLINKVYNEKELEEEVTINLNGINSRVDYNFSTSVFDNQRYIINVNHDNKNTVSNIINHGVVKNDSSLVFEVNSYVKKGNTGSILNQESKIILMSKNNSTIKPNLFIDEFNVDARHAATIGRFNSEDIFYLMTKGINKEDAINLLINGFLNGHIRR